MESDPSYAEIFASRKQSGAELLHPVTAEEMRKGLSDRPGSGIVFHVFFCVESEQTDNEESCPS
jgi:hypothetical protein